jgi:heme exporter protein B
MRKDFLLEIRRGYALGGLLVFVLCIVYIIFISLGDIEPGLWITLYWIAFLFVSVHTVLKGFVMEHSNRHLYYSSLLRPENIFIAKWLYNTLLLLLLGLLMYGALNLVAESPVADAGIFLLAIFAGAVGISLCFTFVSAIAVKSDQSATLMTILSFPLIIPTLLHLIRLSKAALQDSMITNITPGLMTLGAIDLLLAGLGIVLFPYLWRS